MTYRNGTYIAFHANNTTDPTASDIKFYNLIKAWTAKSDDDFSLINSHEKTGAVRDNSKKETLRARLITRLNNSKNMLLIVGKTTKLDTDWVPLEIVQAIDKSKIPVIVAYTSSVVDTDRAITSPSNLLNYWPPALKTRIDNGTANAIHIPFKKEPLKMAINQFDPNTLPNGKGLGYYDAQTNKGFGLK